MQLKKLHWLSAVLLFAIVSGGIVHLMMPRTELPKNDQYGLNDVEHPSVRHAKTEAQQLMALTLKIAELQGQILRINALSERLADDAKIPKTEFNFQEVPVSGGPSATIPSVIAKKNSAELLEQATTLENALKHKEKQLIMLETLTLGLHIQNNSYLSGRPISKGWLSSYYGIRKDPFNGKPSMHKGIDFAGKEGTGVVATGSGVVSWASNRYGYGELVEINHGNGLKTRYGHNKTIVVKVGDVVSKGQVIAKMGSTGRSTGPHVHYEILKNDRQIDPLKYVYRKSK
jgi:murein DD-endopeptidase MepM/ murein hydrolase activator NlpD